MYALIVEGGIGVKEELLKQPQAVQYLVSCPVSDGNYKPLQQRATKAELRCALRFMEKYPEKNKGRMKAVSAELRRREKEKSPGTAIPEGTKKNIHFKNNTKGGKGK